MRPEKDFVNRMQSFLCGFEAGVSKALQILHKELDVSMAFCGHTNIQNVDTRILLPGTFPTKDTPQY